MSKVVKNNIKSIYYLGPEGSYTQIAADLFVTKLDDIKLIEKSQSSIVKVIQSVDNNNEDIGVIPIENSIEGIVRESIDNLITTSSRVLISDEVILPVSHCLIGKSKDTSGIKKVISKNQALAQCRHYIVNKLGANVETINAQSTSEAVKKLKELDESCVAIASSKAAEIYGLNILDQNINDVKDNFTRFIKLSSEPAKPTGNDKTSIVFSTPNTSGALVDILKAFKDNNINLSYIESRPSKKVFGDYSFFIDFDGHMEEEHVKQTIGSIITMISSYRLLGSYPKAKAPLNI